EVGPLASGRATIRDTALHGIQGCVVPLGTVVALLAGIFLNRAVAAEGSELAVRSATTVSAGVVGGSKVALFAGGGSSNAVSLEQRPTVSAGRNTFALRRREARDGQLVVRLTGMTIGVEHGDLVNLAHLEPKRGRH